MRNIYINIRINAGYQQQHPLTFPNKLPALLFKNKKMHACLIYNFFERECVKVMLCFVLEILILWVVAFVAAFINESFFSINSFSKWSNDWCLLQKLLDPLLLAFSLKLSAISHFCQGSLPNLNAAILVTTISINLKQVRLFMLEVCWILQSLPATMKKSLARSAAFSLCIHNSTCGLQKSKQSKT